jgi:hypothetical protein
VVPLHRRDKVSPEKLQPTKQVEPGHFVPWWKERKKQAKSKVLRDQRPKRRKMESHFWAKSTRKEENIYVVKNDMHKIRGLHRVKNKNLIPKMRAGLVLAQGQKTGAADETVQKQENSTRKNGATRK